MYRPAAYWIVLILAAVPALHAAYELVEGISVLREAAPAVGAAATAGWEGEHLVRAVYSVVAAGVLFGLASIIRLLSERNEY
ncbi:hypothetical protein [Muricoccus pecuniae]|uniref:Uncharacterized protein n=1 Tax=Muricoccus pecuniae TaxID=693023 RepID=A0A840XUJ3_9PROT|nr:hypothetical protein [Roseomonas pecuniae]MBB5692215.1 hypothetical protein [Roseomonas pecuniae]